VYAWTRHNAGFLLADAAAERWRLPAFRRAGPARATTGEVDGTPVVIVKPQTFMNLSGVALHPLLAEPGFEPSRDLLVLVDDAAIALGTFRVRARGSAGGHNGLKSVEATLRTREYARLRIGVGPVPEDVGDLADYVLAPFAEDEMTALQPLWPVMVDAVTCWVRDGIDTTMQKFNRPGSVSE
jgi:peptidyl-tRNA hydrolase, PTH1 family